MLDWNNLGNILTRTHYTQDKPYDSFALDVGYIMFIFLMPIIIMNLLVGLAVDDIKGVMENADMEKLIKKVRNG